MIPAVGTEGKIYVIDAHNYRVQVFGDAPVLTTKSTWSHLKALYR